VFPDQLFSKNESDIKIKVTEYHFNITVKTKLLMCHRNRGSSNISTNSFIIIIKTLFNEDAYLTIVNLP